MTTKFDPATEDAPTMLRPSNHLLSPAGLDFGATIVGLGPDFPRASVSVPPSGACKQPSWIQPEDFDPEEWPTVASPEDAEPEEIEPEEIEPEEETPTSEPAAAQPPPKPVFDPTRAKTDQFDAKAYWELMEFDTIDRLEPVSALVRSVRDPEETFTEDVDLAELEAEEPSPTTERSPSRVSPPAARAAAKKRSTDIVPLKTPLPRSKSLPSIPPEGIDRCTWSPSGKSTTARHSSLLLVALVLSMLAAGGAVLLHG